MIYQSLVEALQDKVESDKGIVFIEGSDEETFVPYRQLYQKAGRNLLSLQQRGINPKDELIVMLDNNEYFLHAVWAAFLGGIIPVPVSVGLNDEHRLKLFKIWDVLNNPYLVTNRETYARIEEFAIMNGLDSRQAALKQRTVFYEELGRSDQCGVIRNARPEEIAFIQFSSGSTGDPKGVTLTHKNLLTNIDAIIQSSEISGHDSILSWMPLTHDMGFIGCHLLPLSIGINDYLMPTSLFIRRPTLWLEKVSEHRVSLISSPNFGYKHYLEFYKRKKKSGLDLSCVKLIYNGAESISIPLCHAFLDEMAGYGLKRNTMYTVYGLAEAGLAVTFPTAGEEVRSVKVDRGALAVGQKVVEENEDSAKSVDFADV
jgi:acyl-CoA synthetase (AMP-forming)/AMP-acid ligase II